MRKRFNHSSYRITAEMGNIYREVIDQLKTFSWPELCRLIEQEDALIQPLSFVGRTTGGEYCEAVTSARSEGVFQGGSEDFPL